MEFKNFEFKNMKYNNSKKVQFQTSYIIDNACDKSLVFYYTLCKQNF